MSNENDEIKVSFSISRGFISTQFALIIGAGALYLFSSNPVMKKFLIFAFVLDGIGILFHLLTRNKSNEDTTKKEETSTETETMEVEVERGSDKTEHVSVKKSDAVIKNKVAIPNANAQHRTRRNEGATSGGFMQEPVDLEPTIEIPNPVMPDIPEDENEVVNLNTDVTSDWVGNMF